MNCFSLLQNIIPSCAFKIWILKGICASCSHPTESVKIITIKMKRTIRKTPFEIPHVMPMPCHESVCSRIPQVVAVAPCIYLIAPLIGEEAHSRTCQCSPSIVVQMMSCFKFVQVEIHFQYMHLFKSSSYNL